MSLQAKSDSIHKRKQLISIFLWMWGIWLGSGFSFVSYGQENSKQDQEIEPEAYQAVQFISLPEKNKVQVLIGGALFTEYRYDPAIKKPILFPIKAADGTFITRGFPLEPRPGETVDHVHHTGHWLNHGVVNQVDFWTSTAASGEEEGKVFGAIVQRDLSHKQEGGKGKLTYVADWISDRQDTLLVEKTTFTFAGTPEFRIIDRETILTARDGKVTFSDSKEGMMAVRVARFMEQPYDTPQPLVDQNGKISDKKVVDNEGVKGAYRSSEGLTGDDVWGTRARWVTLVSEKDDRHYSITIMDHPDNVNYPTHWMARGYGLFAANPFGSAAYTEGKEILNFTLEKGESTTLTYRILIHDGQQLSDQTINQWYEDFKKAY